MFSAGDGMAVEYTGVPWTSYLTELNLTQDQFAALPHTEQIGHRGQWSLENQQECRFL